jgi:hypothetical protein
VLGPRSFAAPSPSCSRPAFSALLTLTCVTLLPLWDFGEKRTTHSSGDAHKFVGESPLTNQSPPGTKAAANSKHSHSHFPSRFPHFARIAVSILAGLAMMATTLPPSNATAIQNGSTTVNSSAWQISVRGTRRAAHTSSAELWFLKSPAVSGRKVFAHYLGQYPRSIENATPALDYYSSQYLRASGEGGIHAAYGGFSRDRNLERAPIPGDYALADAKWEIQAAQKVGIDGFFVDILTFSGMQMNLYHKLTDAAVGLKSGFKIIPMLDASGGVVPTATPIEVSAALGYFVGKPSSYYLNDGRYLVASFLAEAQTPSWWTQRLTAIESQYGTKTGFLSTFNDVSNVSKYASISAVTGGWSYGADPAYATASSSASSTAHAAGVQWMGAALTQNIRPGQHTFDEAANSEALRASWARIIRENAEMVQVVTWNDFSEGGQIVPSVARSWGPATIIAYHAQEWKTGVTPSIVSDELILSHRDQRLTGATYQSGQSLMMTQRVTGAQTPVRDRVEALTYLTAPAVVTVRVGGVAHSYTAPAGEHAQTFANAVGTVSGAMVRAGVLLASVTSPFPVTATPVSQDRQYFFVSSLHGTEGQHPMMSR